MNLPESRLSAALRRLGATGPRSAPPALGEMLKNEFRQHHIRRRRERNARILLIAACLAACFGTILILRPRPSKTTASREPLQTTPPSQASVSVGLTEPNLARRSVKTRPLNRTRINPASVPDRFVALPTFDPAIPIDHLDVVRVDLAGRDLRLVGFPISEEIADRRVVADVLLAQDGTPYALRLVQNSETKEQ